MKAFTPILLAFLSSIVSGCATKKGPSLLEERAGYAAAPPAMSLAGNRNARYVPTRVPEKVIVAWLHAKELPSKDYFWGAWLSVVVEQETWEVKPVQMTGNQPPKPPIKNGKKP